MPADDGLRLDDNDELECGVSKPGKANPEQPISSLEKRPWSLLLEDTELLAQGEVLECDTEAGLGESKQEVEHEEGPAEDRDQ